MPIETDAILEVLAELVAARGPCGHEDEVDAVCRRHLEPFCDEVTTDPAGNVVGLIRGQSREPGVKVMAHKDELGAYVKRIEDDGRLSVRPRGFLYRRFGDGPVDVLPDSGEPIPGVIGLGPRHASENPGEPRDGKEVSWEAVRVNTRLSRDELRVRGVHAGSRVVVGRSRRRLFFFEDCVGSYFLDDRAGIALMLAAGAEVRRGGPPPCDVHFICSSLEEIAGGSAAYASHSLPGEILLALDVAPAAPEYDVPLDAMPVILVSDQQSVYSRAVCRALAEAGEAAGTGSRYAAVEHYGSDASCVRKTGGAAQIGCLGLPTDNTHGFEVCVREGLTNCAKLLAAYLQTGGSGSA